MKFTKIKNCHGMTLIELLTALTIMSIIVIAITGLFSQQVKSYETTQQQIELQENIRGVMDEIVSETRNSTGSSIKIKDSGIDQGYLCTGNSVPVNGNELMLNSTITYNLDKPDTEDNYKIYRGASKIMPLTTPDVDITQLSFQGITDGSIKIIIAGRYPPNGMIYSIESISKPRRE